MSQDHRLQQRRFELKYLIQEEITSSLRDFISCYLELDEFGQGQSSMAYPVYSLYFDSDDLKTYHDTINGYKNRFKLRLRYYDEKPNTPVFFEIKGRQDKCILKQRCGVKREAVALLAAGQLPDPDYLVSREPRHLAALQRFNYLLHQINARPKAHNSYTREAWVSPNDNSVRVTFDRRVLIEPFFRVEATTRMERPYPIFSEYTILEVKFTNRYPNWIRQMVQTFRLVWAASAKYAGGVLSMGEHWFHDGYKTRDWLGKIPSDPGPDPARASRLENIDMVYD